jgi:hypothetical protein
LLFIVACLVGLGLAARIPRVLPVIMMPWILPSYAVPFVGDFVAATTESRVGFPSGLFEVVTTSHEADGSQRILAQERIFRSVAGAGLGKQLLLGPIRPLLRALGPVYRISRRLLGRPHSLMDVIFDGVFALVIAVTIIVAGIFIMMYLAVIYIVLLLTFGAGEIVARYVARSKIEITLARDPAGPNTLVAARFYGLSGYLSMRSFRETFGSEAAAETRSTAPRPGLPGSVA